MALKLAAGKEPSKKKRERAREGEREREGENERARERGRERESERERERRGRAIKFSSCLFVVCLCTSLYCFPLAIVLRLS